MTKANEKGKFGAARLSAIRRLRKARRYFRKAPLFAYLWMAEEYPGYTYGEFLEDLRRRTKPAGKNPKNPLRRYGRYGQMEWHLSQYRLTGELEHAIAANRLRRNMAKPYRILLRFGGERAEYQFSPLIASHRIEGLTRHINLHCGTMRQAETEIEEFINANSYGN